MKKKITISIKKQVMCLFVAVLTAGFTVLNAATLPNVALIGAWGEGLNHAKELGNNRALVVLLHAEQGNTGEITTTGVTYGGQTMTKVGETSETNGSFYSYTGAYVLNNAGITAATTDAIEIVWNALPGGIYIQSAFFVNVNQSAMVGASATTKLTNVTAGIALTELVNTAGDMIIVSETASNDGLFSYDDASFINAYETNVSAIGGLGGGYMQATGVAVTPSLTNATSPMSRVVMQGFVLRKSIATATDDIIANKLLTVYPNPVTDKMIIDLQGDNNQKEVKMYNSIGKEIFSTITNSTSLNVDVKSLNYKGIALVKVVSNNKARSQKLIIE